MCVAQKHFQITEPEQTEDSLSITGTTALTIITLHFQYHKTLVLQIAGPVSPNTPFWKSTVFNWKRENLKTNYLSYHFKSIVCRVAK